MNEAWRLIAENRIEEAFASGEFDDLPGRGRPLDLTEYFNTPAEDRMAFSILKNAGVAPPEVDLLREIEELEKKATSCTDTRELNHLDELIQNKRAKLSLTLERRRRMG